MNIQRDYRRINFRTEVDINIADKSHRCDLVDLAQQGALFRSQHELPLNIGDMITISIFLPDSSLRMNFSGELIHQRGQFYGFLFISEDDATMGHLSQLLELNAGDTEHVEQESNHWLRRGEDESS